MPTLDNLPMEIKLDMLKIRCQLSLKRIYEVSVKNFSDYFLQRNYTMLSKETVYELNTWQGQKIVFNVQLQGLYHDELEIKED